MSKLMVMSTPTLAMPRTAARPSPLRPAFAVLVLAMLPAVLDQTVLATALPTIARRLGTLGDVSQLVTVYVLASPASPPPWGKLGDRHGRRSLLGAALTLFLVASAACGLAQTLGQLIVARGIQGLAAGGLMSLAMASVGDLVAPRERARWQGRIATVFAAAAVAGPLIGGLLVEHASWRWVFYVNLPLGLAALAGLRRYLPAGTPEQAPRPLDVAGAALVAVASAAALLVLSWGGGRAARGSAEVAPAVRGWGGGTLAGGSAELLGLAALALAAGAAFAVRERRAVDPVVPLALLAT